MRTLRDTWLIFERSMTLTLRNPVWLIMGLMQPILYLLLFGPLLKNIASMPGFPSGRITSSWKTSRSTSSCRASS